MTRRKIKHRIAAAVRRAAAWLAQLFRHIDAMNARRTDGRSL
jgi:hypothetical protein